MITIDWEFKIVHQKDTLLILIQEVVIGLEKNVIPLLSV